VRRAPRALLIDEDARSSNSLIEHASPALPDVFNESRSLFGGGGWRFSPVLVSELLSNTQESTEVTR